MFKKVLMIFLLIGVSGCAEVRPFVDARREAGQAQLVGQSRPDKIAVCYNPIWHDNADVIKLAEEACAKNKKKAVYSETKYFNCRLISPNTAFYTCQ